MSTSHSERLSKLSQYLKQYSGIWRPSPFLQETVDWQQFYPQLYIALLELNDEELENLSRQPDALHRYIADYLPDFNDMHALLSLPQKRQHIATDKFSSRNIPGRKWQQIVSFLGASQADTADTKAEEVVDWCAGKSHLGRTAAQVENKKLRAIEHSQHLCYQGQTLAEQAAIKAEFECKDVLKHPFVFAQNQQVLALHACGDLHRKLVDDWRQSQSKSLVLAPCCYEKWLTSDYAPLSRLAQNHDLKLSRDTIRLAVQETVTAPERETALMHQLKIYRLAFDILQREIRGVDVYLPTPSLTQSTAKLEADKVLAILAEKKQLELPKQLDVGHYVALATQRYNKIRRLQLARQGFRRAIELWVVSDLALYLEEAGCDVALQEFCPRDLSPRNIQLIATRQS